MTSFFPFWRHFFKKWNTCYINRKFIFLTMLGCEKSEFFNFQIWRHYDIIYAMLTSFCHVNGTLHPKLKTLNYYRMDMANTSFWHLLGLKNPKFNSFSKSTSLWHHFCHFTWFLDKIKHKNTPNRFNNIVDQMFSLFRFVR